MNNDIIKHIRSKDNFVIIGGESGMGKTVFLNEVKNNLKTNFSDKIRIWEITNDILTDEVLLNKYVDKVIDDYKKQVIIIDNGEHYFIQIVQFIEKLYSKEDPRSKPEVSFCLATSGDATKFKTRFLSIGVKVIHCNIIPLDI